MKNSIIQSLYQQSTDITYNCTRTLADHLTNLNNIGKNALNHFTSASKNLNYATQLYYVVQVVSYVGGNYVLQDNYTLQTANNMIYCLSALDTQLNMLGRTATGLLNTSTTIAKVLNSTSTYLKPDMKHNYTSTRDGNLTKSNSIGEKSPNYLAYISKELKYATQLRHVTKVLSYISDDDTLQTMNDYLSYFNKLNRVSTNVLNTSTTIAKILGSTSTYFKNVATSVKDFVMEHPSISMRHDKDDFKITSTVPTGTAVETANTNDTEAYDVTISDEESMYYSLDGTEEYDVTISGEESMYYSLDGTEEYDVTISGEESMYYSLDGAEAA